MAKERQRAKMELKIFLSYRLLGYGHALYYQEEDSILLNYKILKAFVQHVTVVVLRDSNCESIHNLSLIFALSNY